MAVRSGWYIVKLTAVAPCEIVELGEGATPDRLSTSPDGQHWGAVRVAPGAIAKRVGLIRAGKCQPQ
ncbi:MAG: hypothetical protein HC795_02865 [Coleofasciculaceae cyanobacterium RL_1_1]|nr:hypothetical protein [Coleofasciculaceae cyanobacterium RL_1_1]